MGEFGDGCNMHGCRKGVIGRLAHIAVIIGMHRVFGADLAAQDFNGPVGDHLIGIHVGLGTGACLPDNQGEMRVQFTGSHFSGRLINGRSEITVKLALRLVYPGRCLLDNAEGMNKRPWHGFIPNGEIHQGASGLRAVIFVARDFKGAKRVGFGTGFLSHSLSLSENSSELRDADTACADRQSRIIMSR